MVFEIYWFFLKLIDYEVFFLVIVIFLIELYNIKFKKKVKKEGSKNWNKFV